MTAAFQPATGFKGLWIPICILIDADLPPIRKIILAEVFHLQKDEGCFASNAHFCSLTGCKERNLRNHLAAMIRAGLLVSENATSKRRRLFVSASVKVAIEAERQTPVSAAVQSAHGCSNEATAAAPEPVTVIAGSTMQRAPSDHLIISTDHTSNAPYQPAIDDHEPGNEGAVMAMDCRPARQRAATENTVREQSETTDENTINEKGMRNFAEFSGTDLSDDGTQLVSDATWEAWMERQHRLWLPPEEHEQIAVLKKMVRDGFNGEALVSLCLSRDDSTFWENPPIHLVPAELSILATRRARTPLYEV
jgi:hypothetical protein